MSVMEEEGEGYVVAGVASVGPPVRRSLALLAVLVGQGLLIADLGVIAVAIPTIKVDLGASVADIQLLIAFYSLAFAVLLITGGRLGDLYGRRRLLILGLVGFTVASVLSAGAPTPEALVGARLLAGLAAALIAPQVLAIIQVNYSAAELPKVMARFAVACALGMIASQIGTGLLIRNDVLGNGWRVAFLVEAFLGVAAVVGSIVGVRETPMGPPQGMDMPGVLTLSAGLSLFVYPLVMVSSTGWKLWVWASLTASVPVLVAFVRMERRLGLAGGSPLLDLRLFRVRAFRGGLTLSPVFSIAAPPMMFLFTLLVQTGLGYDPFEAGLMFAGTALAFLVASTFSARLVDAIGRDALMVGGLVTLLGTVWLVAGAFVQGDGLSPFTLVTGLVLGGFGQGLIMAPLLSFVMAEVPSADAGAAGGAFSTVQQLGIAVGVALSGLVFASVLGHGEDAAAYARAFAVTLLVLLLPLNVLILALVPLLPKVASGRESPVLTDQAG